MHTHCSPKQLDHSKKMLFRWGNTFYFLLYMHVDVLDKTHVLNALSLREREMWIIHLNTGKMIFLYEKAQACTVSTLILRFGCGTVPLDGWWWWSTTWHFESWGFSQRTVVLHICFLLSFGHLAVISLYANIFCCKRRLCLCSLFPVSGFNFIVHCGENTRFFCSTIFINFIPTV